MASLAFARERLRELEVDGVVETGERLGSGSYGVVMEMKVRGLRCAGKRLHSVLLLNEDAQPSSLVDRFVSECLFHSKLQHPNIVQLIGIHTPDTDPAVPTIIMEYLPMTLTKCLETYPCLPDYMEYSILSDVAVGLEYLHSQTPPIMHRDLTPNNVLLTSNMHAKISDLGQAKILGLSLVSKQTTTPGNACYMPPEALVSQPLYSTKLDVFSFGVLIMHVALHTWPFPQDIIDEKTHQVRVVPEYERRKKYVEKMDKSSPLTKLAVKCIQNDPTVRPDASELVCDIQKSSPPQPFTNALEMQLELEAKSKECQFLKQHIQTIESQVTAIHDDVQSSTVLDKSCICAQLQSVLTHNKLQSTTPSDSALIAAYSSPHGHRKNDIKLSVLRRSGSKVISDESMEIIVRTPLSLHFTGTLVRSIEGISDPAGLACNHEGQLFIACAGWKGVLIYSRDGDKIGEYVLSLTKFTPYKPPGYCYYPKGIAIDKDGNFILVDTLNHRIQKFELSSDLKEENVLKCVGKYGSGDEQFNTPLRAQISKENGDVYVCDKKNHRIQVLDRNLNFKSSFGKLGDGPSEFFNLQDIAFDSKGNIYVVDCGHYEIKVFSPKWEYLGAVGGEGQGRGSFQEITGIYIDQKDYIYVTDFRWNCVQVFDPQREFVMQVLLPKTQEGKTSMPVAITADCSGYVYVSCRASSCVHVFK